MSAVFSVDARNHGDAVQVAVETTPEELDSIVEAASGASDVIAGLCRGDRAALLRSMADALESDRSEIVSTADRETGLGTERLNGELSRTTAQFGHFADVVADGAYLEVIIDHETPDHPELRRWLRPLGPVAVFGASNFPLAFSVPGGDTASALAAGCPVVVKAHPSHPATSIRCAQALGAGLTGVGVPPAAVGLVHGTDAGARLVSHRSIAAVGFTGSLQGGRALFDLAAARPEPIPFYGELGSLNPVVVTGSAARQRGVQIANDFVDSVTLGGGQFCTKPGLAFIPEPHAAAIVATIKDRIRNHEPTVLLNSSIASRYTGRVARLIDRGIDVTTADTNNAPAGRTGAAAAVVSARDLTSGQVAELAEECFGPFTLIVIYSDSDELTAGLRHLPRSLTATIHAEATDSEEAAHLLALLERKAGRIVFNDFPTGVAVTWAMHHGGQFPASTSPLHTSVGATAIRRWLRPIAYQNVPEHFLSQDLSREPRPPLPRRVDGTLRAPTT